MEKQVSWRVFLWDVLMCSLGAYGGPEAHYGVFTERMIIKKKYITEEDLSAYIALTSIIPGPSSTQTIISIGYQMGGPLLAFLTMLVWALPVVLMMTILSFLYAFLANNNISSDVLRFIGPMAVGFIAIAAFRIGKKSIKNTIDGLMFGVVLAITLFFRAVWVYPTLLFLGGMIAVIRSKEQNIWNKVKITPPYRYLLMFAVIAIGSFVLALLFDNRLIFLFDHFFRYGYLIIGGGQVVVPYMYTDLVEVYGFMTSQEFLTGFGLVQGLPGPMFSFSAYAGGMASRGFFNGFQFAGGLISALAIFLPGVLLIYFIFPIWTQLKDVRGFRIALSGITVVASALITSAGILLMRESGLILINFAVLIVTALLLFSRKVPAPLIVIAVLLLGILI